MRKWWFAISALALGCSGGGGKGDNTPPPPPPKPTLNLRYTDPVSTGWRIGILQSASTNRRIVLSLYGPETQIRASAVTFTFDPRLRGEGVETYVGRPSLIIRKGKQQFMGATDGGTYSANRPMQSWAVELSAPVPPGELNLAATKLIFVGPDGKQSEQTVALGKLEAVP